MTKKILGLDIGVSSVGLAVVDVNQESQEIIDLAVRIVPEDPKFHGKFYTGNTASKNLARTTDRGIRRNNQRFKLRRNALEHFLQKNQMMPNTELMQLTALQLYAIRSKAVNEQISLQELGRVLILLNQRRGFLSNRKSNSDEENSTDYKKRIESLQNNLAGKTIGQQLYQELAASNNIVDVLLRERTYLRASYIEEFDRIWECQSKFYPNVLTGSIFVDNNKGTFFDTLRNKIIYYQRPLKSQKDLVNNCTFEKSHKAIHISSPFYEVFTMLQKINDLEVTMLNGIKLKPNEAQRKLLFESLFYCKNLNANTKLSLTEIRKILGLKRTEGYLNYVELDGSRTYFNLKNALLKAGVKNPEAYLNFNYSMADEKGGLFELWHITYSIPNEKDVVNTLQKRFKFTLDEATIITKNVGYKSNYGSLSTRAIKKLLPHLFNGFNYSQACDNVGYDHSGYKTKIELQQNLKPILPNSLRNPVVEQILNQVVNMVNNAIEKHGHFDEIRVELSRELRNSAKTRSKISEQIGKNKKSNQDIINRLKDEYNFKLVNGRDIEKYKLWVEAKHLCIYCNNAISKTEYLTDQAAKEHILPKSRVFSNNMNNFIIAHRRCNDLKNQSTAYDFMLGKGDEIFNNYVNKVNDLYNKGSITKAKFDNLMCSGNDIPSDFVERMKKDTQYITKEAVKMLKTVCKNTFTTTGQITDFLREKWGLKQVMQEINIEKYRAINQTEFKEYKDGAGNTKKYETIINWSKRDDHRHHAVDALICALTNQKIIYKLNNLNKLYQLDNDALSPAEKQNILDYLKQYSNDITNFNLKTYADVTHNWFAEPIPNLRYITKQHLNTILISIKKSVKVLTENINNLKNGDTQTTWTPRGQLHQATIMGQQLRIAPKKIKLNDKFNANDTQNYQAVNFIVNPQIKNLIVHYLASHNNNYKVAFNSKTLKANPLMYNLNTITEVQVYEYALTKRVKLGASFSAAMVEKIIDSQIKKIIVERINLFNGNNKLAFSNLIENPIWLNKTKGIAIKSIKIYDENKVEAIRSGYAKTGGNHHALIYKNAEDKFIDKVVSFWEAVEIGRNNIASNGKPYPIINRNNSDTHGTFQFSMQINDLFVFDLKHNNTPTEPNEIDFFNTTNRGLLSTKLFRLQKLSKGSNGTFQVDFRLHLETSVERTNAELRGLTWDRFQSIANLKRLTKIKINNLGNIIIIGE